MVSCYTKGFDCARMTGGFLAVKKTSIAPMSVFGKSSRFLKQSGVDNNTVTQTAKKYGFDHAIYGADWLDSESRLVHRWKVELSATGTGYYFGFIYSGHHEQVDKDCRADKSFLHDSRGYIYADGSDIGQSGHSYPSYDNNEFAVFTLDLMRKQIRISTSDGEYDDVVLFQDIPVGADISYKLVMRVVELNSSVTVTAVQIEQGDEEKEAKANGDLHVQVDFVLHALAVEMLRVVVSGRMTNNCWTSRR